MKVYALVNSGLEQTAQQEVQEILNVKATAGEQVVAFSVEKKEQLLQYIARAQAVRRILIAVGVTKDLTSISVEKFPWQDYFTENLSFKIEVEHVKGQENRLKIARTLITQVIESIEKSCNCKPKIDVKNPDILLVVQASGDQYYIGIDVCSQELNKRHYRVFPHQASFKGDLAYFFVRASRFKPGENLLVGFCKDGTIAIEAALFATGKSVNVGYNIEKFPLFSKDKILPGEGKQTTLILAFDENRQNITAARKNAQLAGVKDAIDIQKYSLDELDVRYNENQFDRVILQVTTKDEEKINEIYYQLSYVLKKKGTALFITRPNWELPISDKFVLLDKQEIVKGESSHLSWLLELK